MNHALASKATGLRLGIQMEQRQPHYAMFQARPTRTHGTTSVTMTSAVKGVEANTTLMMPMYSQADTACNPFVHPVAKRVISFAGIVGAGALLIIGLRRGGGDIA